MLLTIHYIILLLFVWSYFSYIYPDFLKLFYFYLFFFILMHPCKLSLEQEDIFWRKREGRKSHKTDGFAQLKYVNNMPSLISDQIYCTVQRNFSLTGLPNAEKHLCFQVKQLSSLKSCHFRSERNKCRRIFKADTGSDKCFCDQSQLEAFMLDFIERICTPTHLCRRGPVLEWTLHCPVDQTQTFLLASLTIWSLSVSPPGNSPLAQPPM